MRIMIISVIERVLRLTEIKNYDTKYPYNDPTRCSAITGKFPFYTTTQFVDPFVHLASFGIH
jgi:hypothetical protein